MAARKVSKQTSARVSSIVGRVLARLRKLPPDVSDNSETAFFVPLTIGELRALVGSALSQDETPRKVAKRGKRRG
jgi:hypothetical protein